MCILLCLFSSAARAAEISWNGATNSDVTNGVNWDGGTAPLRRSRKFSVRRIERSSDLAANNVTWDRIRLNNVGPTTLNGSGTITLNASANPAFFSEGGPLSGPSIINPNITTTGNIQSNGNHDVTFNGTVTASKIEAFNSTSIYNGDVTVTGTGGNAFVTGQGKVVFKDNFHWNAAGGEYGLNGAAPDVTFTTLSSNSAPIPMVSIS